MGKPKRDLEEMPDHIYLAATYHIPVLIMARFLISLQRNWKYFLVPEDWLQTVTLGQLRKAGIDADITPCREFFGIKYYKLYKYDK